MPQYCNTESLKSVINAVNLPFMFFFYRDAARPDSTDDKRQELLLAAADAGAFCGAVQQTLQGS